MATLTLDIPESLEKEHDETVRFLAAKLCEAGKLTLGQAAEMCNMQKWDFLKILGDYDVNYLDGSAGEDLESYKKSALK